MLSCSSYVCAFSLTPASLWVSGAESKVVLNRESHRVDLPIPVSPDTLLFHEAIHQFQNQPFGYGYAHNEEYNALPEKVSTTSIKN